MTNQHLSGGCRCGAIRYVVKATPLDVIHCHCSMCRRSASAPFLTWMSVPADALDLGESALRKYKSSDQGARSFCPACGCQILFHGGEETSVVYVTAASLDDPEAVKPISHSYIHDALRWMHIDDGLPRFETEADQ